MGPFHVEGFGRLPRAGRVYRRHGPVIATAADVRAVFVEFHEAGGIRLLELLIELSQIADTEVGIRAVDKLGVIVGIDDGDGLA